MATVSIIWLPKNILKAGDVSKLMNIKLLLNIEALIWVRVQHVFYTLHWYQGPLIIKLCHEESDGLLSHDMI